MKPDECPVRAALTVIGGKWKPVIARYLVFRTRRFGELRKLMPDATQKMLTQQLRELESDGVIARKVYRQVPPKVEYSLTAYGLTLRPVLHELCKWGEKHMATAMIARKRRVLAQESKPERVLSARGM
jgi:DNA-binding HxlR family transcriptional regulator